MVAEREQGEPKTWIPFLDSSEPGRTQVGGGGEGWGEAYLGEVRPSLRGCAKTGPRKMNGENWKSWLGPEGTAEDRDRDVRKCRQPGWQLTL